MSDETKAVGSRTAPYVLLAFLIMAVLQLTNVIDISWWWITAPVWVYLLVVWGYLGLTAMYDDVKDAIELRRKERNS